MAPWTHLAHLEAEDGKRYFASIDAGTHVTKLPGQSVTGFSLFADFLDGKGGHAVTIKHVFAPYTFLSPNKRSYFSFLFQALYLFLAFPSNVGM